MHVNFELILATVRCQKIVCSAHEWLVHTFIVHEDISVESLRELDDVFMIYKIQVSPWRRKWSQSERVQDTKCE